MVSVRGQREAPRQRGDHAKRRRRQRLEPCDRGPQNTRATSSQRKLERGQEGFALRAPGRSRGPGWRGRGPQWVASGFSQICPTPGQMQDKNLEPECHQRGTHTEKQSDGSRVVGLRADAEDRRGHPGSGTVSSVHRRAAQAICSRDTPLTGWGGHRSQACELNLRPWRGFGGLYPLKLLGLCALCGDLRRSSSSSRRMPHPSPDSGLCSRAHCTTLPKCGSPPHPPAAPDPHTFVLAEPSSWRLSQLCLPGHPERT